MKRKMMAEKKGKQFGKIISEALYIIEYQKSSSSINIPFHEQPQS